jgi:AmmeMemoRadiSam system protein A
VTLKKKGQLRGCIGHMAEDTPLAQVVGAMAIQAAFNDRRFRPVLENELADIEVEISVLTPAKPVSGPEEIVIGRDGVILAKRGRSAVFLPQVATEQGWSRDEMLEQLSKKAGLPSGSWKEGAQFKTFQAEVFHESEFK